MRNVGCYLIIIFGLISCNNQKNKISNETNNTAKHATNESKDFDKEPYKTVINFLKWYKENYKEINKFELVDNVGLNNDTTKFYSVNQGQTEMYLQKMKSSGFISILYIKEWERYFDKSAKYLRTNPQNDGPPEGFDYDFVLLTQEIDETLNAIDNPKLINISTSQNKSRVKVNVYMELTFHLTKNNDKWLIDKIENI